jgi:hypothetical protein
MALHANGNRLGLNPCKHVGAATTIYNGSSVRDTHLTGRRRNLSASQGITTQKASVPSGYRHSGAWVMPQKAGALSSHNQSMGYGYAQASITDGRNVAGQASGSSVATATAQLVVSMVGSVSGTSTVVGNILAVLLMTGSAVGSSTVTGLVAALGWLDGLVQGTSTASLVRYATGRLSGDITPYTELSPQSLSAAVWNAILAQYDVDGTTGKALAAAQSAGDPWATLLPGTYGEGTAGRAMIEARGLSHENFILDEQEFDTHDPPRLISARARIFANSADCENEVNPIATYAVTSVYGAGAKFKAVKQ